MWLRKPISDPQGPSDNMNDARQRRNDPPQDAHLAQRNVDVIGIACVPPGIRDVACDVLGSDDDAVRGGVVVLPPRADGYAVLSLPRPDSPVIVMMVLVDRTEAVGSGLTIVCTLIQMVPPCAISLWVQCLDAFGGKYSHDYVISS